MNVLVITNLFPNSLEPSRGIYSYQQAVALQEIPGVTVKVIAPIPFNPPFLKGGAWSNSYKIPRYEKYGSFEVHHPRYIVIPKILRCLYGFFLFLAG